MRNLSFSARPVVDSCKCRPVFRPAVFRPGVLPRSDAPFPLRRRPREAMASGSNATGIRASILA